MSPSPAPSADPDGVAGPGGPSQGPLPRPSGVDERQHRRARAHWPIRLIGASGKVASGWVWDVSEGGMGVVSSVHMPVGSIVQTAVAIPNPKDPQRHLAVQAKVRVVFASFTGTQTRLGVQFLALPLEVRMAIHAYVVGHA
ncbi:PilZ domain-containing protein [Roseateles sp. LYH14W]|uniref:PilZ domain-containing protein n=1 Tax=Pelomonas parva TaxID=3299032 RepID=A0ABW7F1X0_9BURK